MPDDMIRVTNIQRLCVNDGPGVRTVIFLKGCYLSCPWCCNPETINYNSDKSFLKKKCKHHTNNRLCVNCEKEGGTILKEQCPYGVYEKTFVDYHCLELYGQIIKDEYVSRKDGGVTFSGGDPLFQAFQLAPLLKLLKQKGIHIAIETSLYAPNINLQHIKEFIDYWIVDLKFQFGFFTNSQYIIRNDFEDNLKCIQQKENRRNTHFRIVIMSEVISKIDNIIERLLKNHIDEIELLSYHSLAKNKYNQLAKPFRQFTTPTEKDLINIVENMANNTIRARFNQV